MESRNGAGVRYPIVSGFFVEMGFSLTFCPGWPSIMIQSLPLSSRDY